MSFKINQEINNIKNSVNNLNITTSDNTQSIMGEEARAKGIENNILGALLIEKNRAKYAEQANEQAILSEMGRAKAAEALNAQSILDKAATTVVSVESNLQSQINNIKAITGINNVFSIIKTTPDRPLATNFQMWSSYNNIIKSSPYITYVAPDVNNGGVNTGFICQTAGYYKIEYILNVKNETYMDRVCWFSKIMINGAGIQQRTFIYTRANDVMYVQYGSASAAIIQYCNQNDYIQLLTLVAKNSNYFNNNFDGLIGDTGSNFIITYLGL